VLAYDWTADLLSQDEKAAVLAKVRKDMLGRTTAHEWYESRSYGGAPAFRILVALAWHGDKVDDEWCEDGLNKTYDAEDPLWRGPYGPKKGHGYLDSGNSMALDSGGIQAGNHGDSPLTGYSPHFLNAPVYVLPIWQTATGEDVVRRFNVMRRLPYWLAYESEQFVFKSSDGQQWVYAAEDQGKAVLEYVTGLYAKTDPDMAALAAWQIATSGRSRYLLVPRLIMGDLRVKPKSPADLALPTAAYLRGADIFASRSGWGPDDTLIRFQIRYLDTSRSPWPRQRVRACRPPPWTRDPRRPVRPDLQRRR
jgi:hypothetical protein